MRYPLLSLSFLCCDYFGCAMLFAPTGWKSEKYTACRCDISTRNCLFFQLSQYAQLNFSVYKLCNIWGIMVSSLSPITKTPNMGVSGAICRAGVGTAGVGSDWKEALACWMSQVVSVCHHLSRHVSHPRLWQGGLEYIRQSCRSIWCHFRCNRRFDSCWLWPRQEALSIPQLLLFDMKIL